MIDLAEDDVVDVLCDGFVRDVVSVDDNDEILEVLVVVNELVPACDNNDPSSSNDDDATTEWEVGFVNS
jgi:hypothetical protein